MFLVSLPGNLHPTVNLAYCKHNRRKLWMDTRWSLKNENRLPSLFPGILGRIGFRFKFQNDTFPGPREMMNGPLVDSSRGTK